VLASNDTVPILLLCRGGGGTECRRLVAIVSAVSLIVFAVERQSVVAEPDDVRRQLVEPGRPRRAQRLRGADHRVSVVQSLLVPVDGEQAGPRPGVGDHGVLAPADDRRRREVDVPLLPERPLAAAAALADEPVGRQDAVDERRERRVDGVDRVEPVLELAPADRVRREAPRADDLPQSISTTTNSPRQNVYREPVSCRICRIAK